MDLNLFLFLRIKQCYGIIDWPQFSLLKKTCFHIHLKIKTLVHFNVILKEMKALKKIIVLGNLFNCQREKLQWVVNECSLSNTNQME